MKLRDAVIERNEDLIGELWADRLDSGLHTLHGSEVYYLAGVQVYAVDPPVPITSLVLEVESSQNAYHQSRGLTRKELPSFSLLSPFYLQGCQLSSAWACPILANAQQQPI